MSAEITQSHTKTRRRSSSAGTEDEGTSCPIDYLRATSSNTVIYFIELGVKR
jgi:hypothetical protein